MKFSDALKKINRANVKIESTINVMGNFILYRCSLSDGTTAMEIATEPSEQVEKKAILKALYFSGLLEAFQNEELPKLPGLPEDLPKIDKVVYKIDEIDFRGTISIRVIANGDTYQNREQLGKIGFEFDRNTKSWSRHLNPPVLAAA
jgi:hypothetical protein